MNENRRVIALNVLRVVNTHERKKKKKKEHVFVFSDVFLYISIVVRRAASINNSIYAL